MNERRRKYIVIAVVFLAGSGIAAYLTPTARTVSLGDEEWDICEAVVRYQVFHSAAGGRGTATAYLRIRGGNPPRTFLDRFRGHDPPVRFGCRLFRFGGVLYSIGGIKRTGKDSAEVDGGYYEGRMSSSGNTYYVVRRDGKWVVERDVMHWISAVPRAFQARQLLTEREIRA